MSLFKNLWPFQLDTVGRIHHCLWRPHTFPFPRNHLFTELPAVEHTGYTSHGKEGQSLELRTAKVFLLVARLGEL